ncbi:MAG TPA: T9SS type A sorting domain-containing protein [Dyadobacter sp.]|jgi:glucuronoarabinoxylan endo-1,4-beta-xylanase|nr:T9SS type A sorting domain-containing protein [Dyadobacter sp.]
MKRKLLWLLLVNYLLFNCQRLHAQALNATVKLNKDVSYQNITGFGGFVNSPQFAYNHMTEAEIRKMWGANSEAGYNIMRIYIPIGEANWPQSLATAQLAQSLGLKIFASPWSMPAEWKTYNTIASKYTDDGGVVRAVYLKEEHYATYAKYLDDFVRYLRTNGVELEGISLQNEPDYQVDYAGCIWTPAQMASFIKNHANNIDCKIIAPETVGITDNYAAAFMDPAVLANFDIFGGHQYGAVQTGHLDVQAQGKEVWMTEFLINWNAEGGARNYDWQRDAFDFATKVNDAMLANINAWVHYATKRYYGQMGDGEFGTTAGEITKRGQILSHYAKYVTGAKRIQNIWNDNTSLLNGSSYISQSGNKVFVVVINSSANAYNLSVDLPFLSNSGKAVTTTSSSSMVETNITFSAETARPKVTIGASSITTLVFDKSGEREVSQMTSEIVNYGKIENQIVTNPAFGTVYQLSGKTVTIKHDQQIISPNKTADNGYLQLTGKFNKLVFRVENLTSSYLYSSSATTLYYVNSAGDVKSHNYGNLAFDRRQNFDWVFDISENVLTDGCSGIIGISNGNYSSVLTFKFANVYLAVGNERGYRFSGIYSNTDSYLLDALDDKTFTSYNFSTVSDISNGTDWHSKAANKNAVFHTQNSQLSGNTNVVYNGICANLALGDMAGDFYSPIAFTATSASYSCTLAGSKMLVLPFEASIPSGVKAYTIEYTDPKVTGMIIIGGKIPANTPVLVNGNGNFVFEGSGAIAATPNVRTAAANSASARNMQVGITGGVYIGIPAPVGSYYLDGTSATPVFNRITGAAQRSISSFDAYIAPGLATTAASLELILDESALPVRLGEFTAKAIENVVLLNWTTYSEKDNAGFDIEHSTDAVRFTKIGSVKGNGNSETANHYNWIDSAPLAAVSYYRLKQNDLDGKYAYSSIRSVNFGNKQPVVVYPNPVRNTLTLDLKGNRADGKLSITNASGQQVIQSDLIRNGKTDIDVSRLNPGLYFYNVGNFKGSFLRQ